MTVRTFTHRLETRGEAQIVDLTRDVLASVAEAGITDGTASLFVPGSTAGLTTIEYEPGVVHDLQDCFERLAPRDLVYAHEEAWHDGNGHSHVRAALLGPSLVLPIMDGRPVLGTWQQVVLVDFDNKPRRRNWTLTVIGE
jgi:secondary thiamine-phosphate synthase enzyme